MRAEINSQIYLTEVPPQIGKYLEKLLSIENPLYKKLQYMRKTKALYGVQETFAYYLKNAGGSYALPRGCMPIVKALCDRYEIPLVTTFTTQSRSVATPFKSDTLVLRDYQEGVAEEALKESVGILKLSGGFGKTIIALKLIELTQRKTLIIVPRNHLLEQYFTELKQYYPKAKVVRLHRGWNGRGDVVLATMQTLASLNRTGDLKKYGNTFGMVIADECSGYITKIARKVIANFNCTYLYGLTATPERSDGQSNAIFFTFGRVLVERELPQKKPRVEVVPTHAILPVAEYHDMVEMQIEHEERNKLVVKLAHEQVAQGRKVIILTKRIAHTQKIVDLLDKELRIVALYSSNTKENNKVFHELKKTLMPYDIIIGTFSLLGTGTDVPSLDTLILAGDLVSAVLHKQSVYRITRLFEGKTDPLVIDMCDNKNKIFRKQFNQRHELYRACGWQVKIKT